MKAKTWIKKNYWNVIWVVILIGGISLIYVGGKEGWFQKSTTIITNQTLSPNQQTILNSCSQVCQNYGFSKSYTFTNSCNQGETKVTYGYPNQAPLLTCCCYNEIQCSISVDKTVVNEGQEVIGTIQDGANTKCEIFMNKDNAGWIKSEEAITDANGKAVITNSLMAGVYQFYVKCGTCTSNTLTITSNKLIEGLTPNEFCSQSCTNSYFNGGRGTVNSIYDCNLQVESPFVQGYGEGETALCCCNHFDRIGCGRYGGSFGYTRNALVMPESTLNYCSEVAFEDCQSTGKTVKNYNIVSTCCMWNCI